ncbi:fibronectin type III domain-containing protein [Microvirga sp. STR05]|uniref:Fibronectin type III domain-containing protein n=1 Tax=Hymenobacter duratus TaxID=2771356 RepID=A0ABR8JLN7_9BACT|nr:fibronectin type III domain-containing protein [Hymenobacter duratus]MBD2716282.1 fibronectin type III domain-containing protein [Hymenobacter duratus]MBR7951198.1 fibronectin type III domain-containing protein [Microvirga sp. STR05]
MRPLLLAPQLLPKLLRLFRPAATRAGTPRYSVLLLAAFCLAAFTARAQAPANDDPCSAQPLTLNGSLCTVPTVGTNTGATTTTINGTVSNTCGAFNNPTPKDVWYSFTTAATGSASAGATITVTGNPAGLIRLFSAASCSGTFTQISCSASNASNTAAPRLVTGALQPNTTYYVQVAGYTSTDTQGQFTICITDPPTCGAPAVLGVTFPTPTSAAVAFTAGPGNTTFTVMLNGGQTINNATSPATFTGLTPGTTYFATVRTECGGSTLTSPFFSFTVPLLNDDPCGAIALPITSTCSPTTGTTFGASTTTPNGYANPGCALDASPLDVWYSFTTPATGGASTSATITVTGNAAGQIRLFSAASCSGPLTQLGCSQSATGPALPLSSTTLTPSTTYYVLVAGQNDNSIRGTFTICVTGAAACPDPTNLAIVSTSTTTADLTFTPSGNATSYNVTYVPASGGTPITLTVTGSPATLTGLTSGTAYTVTLQSVCPAGVGSILTRTFTATAGTPSNDDCAGATPITSVGIGTCGAPVTGTITGATLSSGVLASSCAGTVARDVWFSVVVPASGTLQVETGRVAGNTLTDTGLELYSGSCGTLTLLGCDDDSSPDGNFSLLRRTGLTPGSTVYARVWRFGTVATGDFTICAQTDVLCPSVSNLAINSISSTSASLSFTPSASATSYTVTYTAQGGTVTVVTPNPGASPVALTGLTPNTVYTATIQSNCPAGSGLPLALTFTTLAPAPANDNCATPTALTVDAACTPVTSSTLGATASAAPVPAPTCGNGIVNDVWFSAVVPANGVVIVSTGASSGSSVADTGLQLYSGTCGSLSSLGCNDNFGGNNYSQVRAAGLTPGSTVYARVWQIGGGTGGAFTVCATTDPPCPSVTNLAVSTITPTSASVTFAAPSAGTSYTVTYTPQGGTATTVTPVPTASPVALTGLTPGTLYTVSITSNCAPGETSAPAVTTFTTSGCAGPSTLAATNITMTSAQLVFGLGNGNSYTVSYTTNGVTTTLTPNPTGTPITLTGLTPGATYVVRVVTNCGTFQSPAAITTFTTQPAPPCNPPTNLAATSVTSTSANVTFTPAAGISNNYTVTYTPQGGTATTISPAPTSSPVALTGLLPATNYTVTVTNNCSGANNPTSSVETLTFTTLAAPCPPVTAVLVSNITTSSATVSFTPGAGNTSYVVSYQTGSGLPVVVTPTPTSSPVLLTGLASNTTYSVCVASNCSSGASQPGVCVTFTTPVACVAPTNTAVSGITATTATVTFTPSPTATSYTVTYTPQGGTATTVTPAPTASPVTLTGLSASTTYSLTITSNCAAGATSPATASVVFSTGPLASRHAALADMVSLYPNPAQHMFWLEVPVSLTRKPVAVTLYSGVGQLLLQRTLPAASTATKVAFEVAELPRGVYSLHLTTSEGVLIKRLVVE